MISSKIVEYQRLVELILMDLPTVKGKAFENETVFLDFTIWEQCTFINCRLIIKYGLFSLKNTELHKCKFQAPSGMPAHAILSLDKMIREAYEREHK